jgi:hypothetical protein
VLTGWTRLSGDEMEESGGVMRTEDDENTTTHYSVTNGSGWTNYTYSADLKPVDNDISGITFRVQNSNNYYILRQAFGDDDHDDWDLRLRKVVGGTATTLAGPLNNYGTAPGQVSSRTTFYKFKVVVNGSNINDSTFSSGTVGVWLYHQEDAQFDNVEVDCGSGTATPGASGTASPTPAASATVDPGCLYFYDDFIDGSLTGWKKLGGATMYEWNGVLTAPQNAWNHYAVTSGYGWTDYSYRALVKPVDDDISGISFRVQDKNNYYLLRQSFGDNEEDGWNLRLQKVVGGVATTLGGPLDNYGTAAGQVSDRNSFYEFKVEVSGNNIKAYIDGVLKFDINDSTFSSGSVGVWLYRQQDGAFDDVEVRCLVPSPTPTTESTATPSQTATPSASHTATFTPTPTREPCTADDDCLTVSLIAIVEGTDRATLRFKVAVNCSTPLTQLYFSLPQGELPLMPADGQTVTFDGFIFEADVPVDDPAYGFHYNVVGTGPVAGQSVTVEYTIPSEQGTTSDGDDPRKLLENFVPNQLDCLCTPSNWAPQDVLAIPNIMPDIDFGWHPVEPRQGGPYVITAVDVPTWFWIKGGYDYYSRTASSYDIHMQPAGPIGWNLGDGTKAYSYYDGYAFDVAMGEAQAIDPELPLASLPLPRFQTSSDGQPNLGDQGPYSGLPAFEVTAITLWNMYGTMTVDGRVTALELEVPACKPKRMWVKQVQAVLVPPDEYDVPDWLPGD